MTETCKFCKISSERKGFTLFIKAKFALIKKALFDNLEDKKMRKSYQSNSRGKKYRSSKKKQRHGAVDKEGKKVITSARSRKRRDKEIKRVIMSVRSGKRMEKEW